MAPVFPTSPDPGVHGGPVVGQENRWHIIAYGALPPVLAQHRGFNLHNHVLPQAESGPIDKSHGLEDIPFAVDRVAVDAFVAEARNLGYSPDLLQDMRDTISQYMIPGVCPISQSEPQQGAAAAQQSNPNEPQDDALSDPHLVVTHNFVKAVFQYAEAIILHAPDRQTWITDILTKAGAFVSSIEPSCLVAALKFEEEGKLLQFLSTMHNIASEIMEEVCTLDLMSKVDELIGKKIENPTLSEKLSQVVKSVVKQLCIALAVSHTQLLDYLKGETRQHVSVTILLHSKYPKPPVDTSMRYDPLKYAGLVKEFAGFQTFQKKLKEQVLKTGTGTVAKDIESSTSKMIMEEIKLLPVSTADNILSGNPTKSETQGDMSIIRKADVPAEPRLYIIKLSHDYWEAHRFVRALVKPYGQIQRIYVPQQLKWDNVTGQPFRIGFCTMATFEECEKVIAALNGTPNQGFGYGERLTVKYAKPTDK